MENEKKEQRRFVLSVTGRIKAYTRLIADICELVEMLPNDEENDRKYLQGVAVMLGEILQEQIEK